MIPRFHPRQLFALLVLALASALVAVACGGDGGGNNGAGGSLDDIAAARGLTPEDMRHALQQFVPPGKYDDYVMFSSGGHSGQVLVIGMPSMRILKVIAGWWVSAQVRSVPGGLPSASTVSPQSAP